MGARGAGLLLRCCSLRPAAARPAQDKSAQAGQSLLAALAETFGQYRGFGCSMRLPGLWFPAHLHRLAPASLLMREDKGLSASAARWPGPAISPWPMWPAPMCAECWAAAIGASTCCHSCTCCGRPPADAVRAASISPASLYLFCAVMVRLPVAGHGAPLTNGLVSPGLPGVRYITTCSAVFFGHQLGAFLPESGWAAVIFEATRSLT